MSSPKELSKLLGKPVSYSNTQEIFTDLDLAVDLMDALTTIFSYIGPFKFYEQDNTIQSNRIQKADEGEHTFNGIKFKLYGRSTKT